MKYILCGNYNQFRNCLDENNISFREAVYVDEPMKIFGCRINSSDIIRYGTYFENPNHEEIEKEILYRTNR